MVGWISQGLGAPWGLISGGAVVVLAALVACAYLSRGRRVHLTGQVLPPRLQLLVSERRSTAPAPVLAPSLRAAEEVAAGQAPGSQTAVG
jgi:hypothetical protein